jgi:hypothetical protein
VVPMGGVPITIKLSTAADKPVEDAGEIVL